jgi:predicted glycoside hydrolase/deacetylase ChbG (UPF0249 family)
VAKLLIVNADDFGFTPDVNAGIVEAHRRGVLTATTLMANGDAFEEAARLAREIPTLDVGCHLTLIGGLSLVSGRALPATVTELLKALARRDLDVYRELDAQIRRILAAGIAPSHLDTHKHTHLAPPVLNAVALLARKYRIAWVRQPFDFARAAPAGLAPFGKRLTSRALGLLRGHFRRVFSRHGCRATDHFAGFQITGRFGAADLVELVATLPEGSTELMVHPGYCGDALRAAPTRLKQSRRQELDALTAPEVREALARHSVELTDYRRLAAG